MKSKFLKKSGIIGAFLGFIFILLFYILGDVALVMATFPPLNIFLLPLFFTSLLICGVHEIPPLFSFVGNVCNNLLLTKIIFIIIYVFIGYCIGLLVGLIMRKIKRKK